MATNPMQRKSRNSFLLGMLLTLVITGAVIAFLIIQLKNYREKEKEEIANSVSVWVLGQDVISGQVITKDMLTTQVMNRNEVPSNAIGDTTILDNYASEDKEGNPVVTEYKNGVGTLYLTKNNRNYELKQEQETQSYYIEENGQKKYVELTQVPIIAKVDLNKNSIITTDMVVKSNEKTTDDLRKQEYNMLVLPTQIQTGEYIDVRLALPSGQDYIVVSKKQVEIPQIGGIDSEGTIWIKMKEDEIITMNNAIVDAYRIPGAKIYVATYTEAGVQNAATTTYVPNLETVQLIRNNPNIVAEAREALWNKYNSSAYSSTRNDVLNSAIRNSGDEGEANVKTKVEESAKNSKDERIKFLQSLGADATNVY